MSKRISLIFLSFLCLNFAFAQSYKINVNVSDFPRQILRLGYHSGPDIFIVDSAMTNNVGEAIFSKEKKLEHGVYFVVMPSAAYFDFLISDDQDMSISTYQFHILDSLKVTGSIENIAFVNFQQKIAIINKHEKQLSIEKRFYQNNKDSLRSVNNSLRTLQNQRSIIYNNTVEMFDGSMLGDIIKAMISFVPPQNINALKNSDPKKYFNYFSSHYFDNVNFNEPGVINSPEYVFHSKLDEYCKYFINSNVDSLNLVYRDIDVLINRASVNEVSHRYIMSYLIDNYEQPSMMGMDAVFVYLARNYFEKGKVPWAKNVLVQEIKRRADLMEQNLVGKTAVNLKFPDSLGEIHSLHEGTGRFTVLWFYDTECVLCLSETPKLVYIYDDLKVMNIDLIAVNIGDDKVAWEKMINKPNYSWLNLWNPNHNPDLQMSFGTHKTPRLYILNAEKRIVAKDVSVSNLLRYIEYLDENSLKLKNEFLFNSPVQKLD
jgi:thiol-disulfide isomerase/thioredoxin